MTPHAEGWDWYYVDIVIEKLFHITILRKLK
jgi:hypothetical protein